MNIKIIQHILPWEIDYALLFFMQLKKSKNSIIEQYDITISTVLNLSSYIIDWEESKIPKEMFIEKYKQISILLEDFKHESKIYEGNEIYGHLDFQRECISKETDYYISTCPDMYFDKYLLYYMLSIAGQINNKYFVLTPQISKMWDSSWDEITNRQYMNIPYKEWDKIDIFDIMEYDYEEEEITIGEIQRSKFAGWFDLYNKAFYEELCPIHDDWKGYGPWDWYSMLLTEFVKQKGIDFQQYLLKGKTIFEYSVGPLKNGGFSKYYKELLSLKNIPNQREIFENQMQNYLNKGIQLLKEKNII